MDKNNHQNLSKSLAGLRDNFFEIEAKTQKIVTALYLVSDLIDEQDPLRKEIRNTSVSLSSCVSLIAIESPSQAKKTITEAQNYVDRLLNILKVCVSVGFVSDMNFKVISEYLTFVRDDLTKKYGLINSQSLIASSFHNKAIHEFILPDFVAKETPIQNQPVVSKGLQEQSIKDNSLKTYIQKEKTVTDTAKSQEQNSQRVDKILEVIKTKENVSIGDVAKEFPELSEKTIQRMLVRLVDSGQLSKTGEKRWSRYSLINK